MINVSEFKARCLAILDEVARTGKPIMVCKRGKPLAQVGPAPSPDARYPQETLLGTVTILGDIVSPPLEPEAWDADKGLL